MFNEFQLLFLQFAISLILGKVHSLNGVGKENGNQLPEKGLTRTKTFIKKFDPQLKAK